MKKVKRNWIRGEQKSSLMNYFRAKAQGKHHEEEEDAEDWRCLSHQTQAFWINNEREFWTMSCHFHERVNTFGEVHVAEDAEDGKTCVEAREDV